MIELFQTITTDPQLQSLERRIKIAETTYKKGVVVALGYSPKNPELQGTPCIYTNAEDFQKRFPIDIKQYNGRVLVHKYGTKQYNCYTDIPDNVDETLKGHWIIIGFTAKNEPIQALFDSIEELKQKQNEIYAQIEDRAIIHEIGTTKYVIMDI